MLFYFLIGIVFISEVIIVGMLIVNLVKLHKKIRNYSVRITCFQPKIKDICKLIRKLSDLVVILVEEQISEFRCFFIRLFFENALNGIAEISLLKRKMR